MKYLQCILLLILFTPFTLSAQQSGKAKRATSYTKEGNRIVFNADDGSKLSLDILSSSVVKVWFDPAGTFVRNNESFAVINEDLEDMGEINVNDEPSCYEIYTSKLHPAE